MEDVILEMTDKDDGAFVILEDKNRIAELVFDVDGENLTVYHTEVHTKLQGKGVGAKLVTRMVEYAREKRLKVVPLCPYVSAQFQKNPEQFTDIWKKS